MITNYYYKRHPEKKKHIRCMFISKINGNTTLYDLALLTDDFQFYFCQLRTRYVDLTSDFWLKVRKMLGPYQFSKTTDVQHTNNISPFEPISIYLKIIQSQTYFNMMSVSPLKVIKGIKRYHPTYVQHKRATIKKDFLTDMPKLWAKLLKYNKCPWITREVDDWINTLSPMVKKRHMFLRMAVYYILVKQYLLNKVRRSMAKARQKKLELEQQIKAEISAEQSTAELSTFLPSYRRDEMTRRIDYCPPQKNLSSQNIIKQKED